MNRPLPRRTDCADRLLRAARHPLALGVSAAAVLAVVLQFSDGFGIFAALFGAVVGYTAAELLCRTPLRLPWVLALLGIGALVGRAVASTVLWSAAVAATVGGVGAIRLSTLVGAFAAAFGFIALPRALVRRRPTWAALEVLTLSSAFVFAFASHRDGAIARPLWLADRAWRWGFDPAFAFLGVGGAFVVALAWLRLGESRRRLTLLSVLLVPFVALLLALWAMATPVEPPPPSAGQGNEETPSNPVPPEAGDGAPASGASGDGNPSGRAVSQQPEVGDEGSSGSKTRPVAVVLLDDDYAPPSEGFYLRQDALSDFDGSALVAATLPGADPDVVDHFPTGPLSLPAVPEGFRQRVRGRVAILVDHRRPFALETPVALDVVPNPNPVRFRRAWRFESYAAAGAFDALIGRTAGDPAWTPDLHALYTEVPQDPRYRALADKIRATVPARFAADPFALALAVKVYLDENTKYSKAERHADVPDPTADFLFGNRIGYCVHTAHAAVLLWRSLGLPARAAAGYYVDAADRRGGALVVMDRDAHEWPEVYLEGVGWTILDISPKENLDPPTDPLDEDLAALLADMANEKVEPEDPPFDREAWRRYLIRAAVVVATSFVVAALALLFAWKAWRRLRPLFSPAAALPRVGYRAALDALADIGVIREDGETREHFARQWRDAYPALERLTSLHLAARLGRPGDPGCAVDRREWLLTLSRLRAELRARHGRFRRGLGILNPFTPWRVR